MRWLIFMFLTANLWGAEYWWRIEVVDSGVQRGQYTSVVLDDSGRPWISYYDANNGWLMCAHWTGTAWDIDTVDDSGNVGMYSNIALDKAGYPHIVYFDDGNTRLKHAWWTGAFWKTETVNDPNSNDYGYWCDIAIDSLNRIWVSYYDADNKRLMCARKVGAVWDTIYIVVEAFGPPVGEYSSICIDTSNNPHISYYHQINGLSHAWWDGSKWQAQQVDFAGGYYTSIIASECDTLHISYYNPSSRDLKYAKGYYSSGSWGWTTQVVDTQGDVGKWTSIAVCGNSPHISYYDATNLCLKYAHFENGSWEIEVVDSPKVGEYTSIALDTNGLPCISYYDGGSEWLKFARLLIRPEVDSTSPLHNEVNVSRATQINVWFSKDIESATINSASFKVIGSQSGERKGTITYDSNERKATFTLNAGETFYTGEKVTVILTDSIKSVDGAPLVPYVFEFTIKAAEGIAEFSNEVRYSVLGTPVDIEVCDLDLDGDPDIVTLSQDTIMIWRNDVDSLVPVDTIPSPSSQYCIAILDLDLDGLPDIVVDSTPSSAPYSIKFYKNQGGLNFAWGFRCQTAYGVTDMFVSDFDGDGDFDIAALELTQVEILLNEGFFNFTSSDTIDLTFSHNKLYGADYNNDGLIDLAVTAAAGTPGYDVLANEGEGKFKHIGTITLSQGVKDIIASDFDNDYNADNALTGDDTLIISEGNGDFSFAPEDDYVATGSNFLTSGDFDADGDIDLAVSGNVTGGDTLFIFLNDNASFDSVHKFSATAIERIVSADFNLDSTIDIASIHSGGILSIFYNTPDTFPPPPPESLTANGGSPSPWDSSARFVIDWINPNDPSGILFANYKIGSRPVSDWDTTGHMSAPYTHPKDTIYWKGEGIDTLWVWLVDGNLNTSKDSVSFVLLRRDTTPPPEPQKISPSDGIWVDSARIKFMWHSVVDSLSGTMSYGIVLEYDDVIGPPYIRTAGDLSGTTYFYTCPETAVYWRVFAKDSATNRSPQSFWCVKIDTTPPNKFYVISPDGVWLRKPPYTFIWHSAKDHWSGVESYKLRVWREGFAASNWSGITDTSYIVFGLPGFAETTYWWCVIAYDSAGNYVYSDTGIFWTDTTILPPSNLTINGKNPNDWTNDSVFTLNWTNPSDYSGIVRALYKIGNRPSSDYDTTGSLTGIPPVSIIWRDEGVETLWLWLEDKAGNVDYTKNAFAIIRRDITPPQSFTQISPVNNFWLNTINPRLIWHSTMDTLSGLAYYTINVDTVQTFSTKIICDTVSDTIYNANLFEDAFYWYVEAWDSAGNVCSTFVWNFKIDTTHPPKPVLISPPDGSWNGKYAHFVWHKVEDYWSGLAAYRLNIDTNALMPNPLTFSLTDTETTIVLTHEGKTYYWMVEAEDSAFNISQSLVWTFKLDTTVLAPINLIANDSSPSPWQRSSMFVINWQNPSDSAGIKFALYKLGTGPSNNWDTTGTMHLPPDTIYWQGEGKETLWVWLCDSAGNVNYHNRSFVLLRRDTTPPFAFSKIRPQDNAWIRVVKPSLIWHSTQDSLSGLRIYRVAVDKDMTPPFMIDFVLRGTLYVTPHLPETILYWAVVAVDSAGNFKEADADTKVWWKMKIDTTPPDTVHPVYPVSNQWTRGGFMWRSAKDYWSGIRFYHFVIDTVYPFTPSPIKDTVCRDTVIFIKGLSERNYYWKVVALDSAFNGGAGVVHQCRVDTTPPDSVKLISPENLSYTNDIHSVFTWDTGYDARSGVMGYIFWDSSLAYGEKIDTLILGVFNTSYKPLKGLKEGWHCWAVVAMDSAYNVSDGHYPYSVHLLCVDTTPPESAIATSPLYVDSLVFVVQWSKGKDTLSGITDTYKLRYSTDLVSWYDTAVTGTAFIFKGEDQTKYYFEVLSRDYAGNFERITGVPECSTYVDTTPPQQVQLISPEGWIKELSPVLIWHKANDFTGIAEYYVQLSKDMGFDTIIFSDTVADTFAVVGLNLMENVKYYWRVRAKDNAGNVNMWSGYNMFKVDTSSPQIPELVSPLNDTPVTTVDDTLTLIWRASYDELSGIYAYQVQISEVPDFSSLILDTILYHPDTILRYPRELNEIKHYWRVFAIDSVWNVSDGHKGTFMVDNTAPVLVHKYPDLNDTVDPRIKIEIAFSEKVDPKTVDTLSFCLYMEAEKVRGNVYQHPAIETLFYFEPKENLEPNTKYLVVVSTKDKKVKDIAGNKMSMVSWSFYTAGSADNMPPDVKEIKTYPEVTYGAPYVVIKALLKDDISRIKYAEYFVDSVGSPGTGDAMMPLDGAFDSKEEWVIDTLFTKDYSGTLRIFIQGKDEWDNWSDAVKSKIIVCPPDTIPPLFDIMVNGSREDTLQVTDTIVVRTKSSEIINPDYPVVCTLKYNSTVIAQTMKREDSVTYTVQFVITHPPLTEYDVKVLGYDYGWHWDTLKDSIVSMPNLGVNEKHFILYDFESPSIISFTLKPETLEITDKLNVEITIKDNYELKEVRFYFDSDTVPVETISLSGRDTSLTTNIPVSGLTPASSHILRALASDICDNISPEVSAGFYIRELDVIPPVLMLQRPDTFYLGDSVLIVAIASEKLSRDSIPVCLIKGLRGNDTLIDTLKMTFVDDSTCQTKYRVQGLNLGVAYIDVYAYDEAGNLGLVEDSVYISKRGRLFDPRRDVFPFPNPVRKSNEVYFHIYVNQNAYVDIRIYTIEGRLVKRLERIFVEGGRPKYSWEANVIKVDISKLKTGLYYAKITIRSLDGKEKQSCTKRFVVIK